MEHSCLCQSTQFDVVGSKDDRTIGRCVSCGLLQTLDAPEEYSTLYTEGDQYHIERLGHTPYRDRYEHDLGIAKLRWPKLMKQYRVLDVGCANGGFIAWAAAQGAQAEGLELNPAMAAWAAETTGLKVYTAWSDIVGLFDIIVYHDVIEHVPDPAAELARVRDHLYPGGLLVLDTPDAGFFAEDPMASHHMKPKEHLWFFAEQHLTALVGMVGFEVIDVDRPIPGKLVVYARTYE